MAARHSTPPKPCLRCGNPLQGKPSHIAKRKYCSSACAVASQAGEGNPHWKGGLVALSCEWCGGSFFVYPSQAADRRFCSAECASKSYSATLQGESHPHWKGGSVASKKRYRSKRASTLGLPDPQPKVRVIRECKACGKPGVPKGRAFHPECSPVHRGLVRWECPGCGEVRMVRHSTARASIRCRPCRSKVIDGPNNPNWKGGITPTNQKIRASDRYKEWRLAVMERDGFTCIWCGQHGGTLHADHIKPFSTHPRLRFTLSNGRTLCAPCHKKTDSYLSKGKKRRPKLAQQALPLSD